MENALAAVANGNIIGVPLATCAEALKIMRGSIGATR